MCPQPRSMDPADPIERSRPPFPDAVERRPGASRRVPRPLRRVPPRLARLPRVTHPAAPGLDVRVAGSPVARLLGLAGLRTIPPRAALLLPRTRSVHTLGMRFALDLLWLGPDGEVVRVDRDVRPWRLRGCAGASAVVERAALR